MNRQFFALALAALLVCWSQVAEAAPPQALQLSEITSYRLLSVYDKPLPANPPYAYVTKRSPCIKIVDPKTGIHDICLSNKTDGELLKIRLLDLAPSSLRFKAVFDRKVLKYQYFVNNHKIRFLVGSTWKPSPDSITLKSYSQPSSQVANTDFFKKLSTLTSDYNYATMHEGIAVYQFRSDPSFYVRHGNDIKKYLKVKDAEKLLSKYNRSNFYPKGFLLSEDNIFFQYRNTSVNCKLNVPTGIETCWKTGPGYDPYDELLYDYETQSVIVERLP